MTYDLLRLHQICSWYCIDLVMIQIHFDCKQKLALTSFLNGQTRPLFCLFLLFSHVANTNTYGINLTINDKSVDGVLGSQTRGGRMESADDSTELLWHPNSFSFFMRSFHNPGACATKIMSLENGCKILFFTIYM